MRNYFLCGSAFQVFVASQIVRQQGLTDAHLILAHHKEPSKLTPALLGMAPWVEIHWCFLDLGFHPFLLYNLRRFNRTLDEIVQLPANLYVGGLNSVHNALAFHRFDFDKRYLSDDGFEIMHTLRGNKESLHFRLTTRAKREALRPFGFRIPGPKRLLRDIDEILTIFYRFAPFPPLKPIIPVNYQLTQAIESYKIVPTVLFLGQPFCQRDTNFLGMDINTYLGILNTIQAHYQAKGLEFQYLAHPREDASRLKDARLSLVHTDELFELYLTQNDVLPRCVASFYSTALISARSLLGGICDTDAWLLPEEFIPVIRPNQRTFVWKGIQWCYEIMDQFGIHLQHGIELSG